jgi:hypothetical protein
MRLRPHRRNLVVWSQSASSADRFGVPSFMRTRRIRRWIRTAALLAIIGLMPLARAVRGRWRTVLAGGVLTAVGVTMRDGPGGLVLLPGLWFLLTAPLVPATRKADRVRRPELERELALTAFSTPGQRRLAASALRAGATRGYYRGRAQSVSHPGVSHDH